MRGAKPQNCCTFMPLPIATSLTATIADPCDAAAFEAADWPPSNCTILASMQRLAKKPRSLAIYGEVCTTFGGATDTPILILRMVVQLGAFCANASLTPSATQVVASNSNVVERFDMACFLPVGRP